MLRNMSKAAQKRFEQVYEGEWDTLDWGKNHEMCCHCALVHETSYRVKDNKLQKKVKIDNKRTYQARRRMGIKIEKTK